MQYPFWLICDVVPFDEKIFLITDFESSLFVITEHSDYSNTTCTVHQYTPSICVYQALSLLWFSAFKKDFIAFDILFSHNYSKIISLLFLPWIPLFTARKTFN